LQNLSLLIRFPQTRPSYVLDLIDATIRASQQRRNSHQRIIYDLLSGVTDNDLELLLKVILATSHGPTFSEIQHMQCITDRVE